jgi:hypothetical protein
MTKILIIAVTCVTGMLCLNSCRKENNQKNNYNEVKTKVTNWLNQQKITGDLARNSRIDSLNSKLNFPEFHLEEDNDRQQLIVVPIENGLETINNKGKNPVSVLLLVEDKMGNIKKGNVVQYVTDNEMQAQTFPKNTFTQIYNNKKITANGEFSFLTITDRLLYEIKYRDGKITSFGKSKSKAPNETHSPPRDPYSAPLVCIDWYLITTIYYVDGTTETSEEYLYTTCQSSGDGGGEGGASQENCESELDTISGNAASEDLGVMPTSETATTREKVYTWIFYKQRFGMWSFQSLEKGKHVKTNNEWRWQSLTHQNVAKEGFIIGGSVNCTITANIPNVSTYNAGMELFYTITASAVCKGSPLELSGNHYSKSPIWNISN